MPISKNEWNTGRKWDTYEQRVLEFLKKNDNAYSINEIMHGIGYRYQKLDLKGIIGAVAVTNVVQDALSNLIQEHSVETRVIKTTFGEETYYKAT